MSDFYITFAPAAKFPRAVSIFCGLGGLVHLF